MTANVAYTMKHIAMVVCSDGIGTHAEVFINPSERRLQRRRGKEISTSIPGDIRDRLELIGDFGDGDTDDGLVEGDEKDGQVKGEDDDENFAQRGVFWFGCFGLDIFLHGSFDVGAADADVCHFDGGD